MEAKERLIKEALKKTKDLLEKRPGSKKIQEYARKLDFKKPQTVRDLIKTQDLNTVGTREKNTAMYEQIGGIWDKIGLL